MQLWRINLKPDSKQGIDAAEFCISRRIVGIGWSVDPSPGTKEEYWQLGKQAYNKAGRSWSAAANAILYRMNTGDLIWTRNCYGVYFLGRIESDWRHEYAPEFVAADIANVRSCTWVKVGAMDNVPGAVINGFRPAATLQVVTDASAAEYSRTLFAALTGEPLAQPAGSTNADILTLLSSEDLEDAVAVWLQVTCKCVAFPSTCKNDTMAFECIFVTADEGNRIGLQVKSGATPINRNDYATFDGTAYLFSASGSYLGEHHPNCVCLEPDTIRQFVMANKKLMPGTVQRWINYVDLLGQDALVTPSH